MASSIIKITLSAQNQLRRVLQESGQKAIRFDIKSGGCSGFEYRFQPVDKIEKKENVFSSEGLDVEVCDKSVLYLLGTEIDWKKDIMGEGFKFKNPMAEASCGCGTSFSPFEK